MDLIPKTTVDYLATNIPIRKLPTPDEPMSRDTVVRVGSWLGITVTMDEFEDNTLSETPSHVRAELETLIPFKFEGYVVIGNDELNMLARILSRSDMFVAQYTLYDTYLKIQGFRLPRAGLAEYLTENLKDLLTSQKPAPPGLIITIPLAQFTPPTGSIESTI